MRAIKPFGVVKVYLVLRELLHTMFSHTIEYVMIFVNLWVFLDLSLHFSLSLSIPPCLPSIPISFLKYFLVKKSINLA